MRFELLPIVDTMVDLYRKPRNMDRFREYLYLLQGETKEDMVLPIAGFNPMANDLARNQLIKLQEMKAEAIMLSSLGILNKEYPGTAPSAVFRVALNLLDDIGGSWTNRYTSDYDSKFRLAALIKRNFCLPVFWTSENYQEGLVRERTLEYGYRTQYQFTHPQPFTLSDHLSQEIFVAQKLKTTLPTGIDVAPLDAYYQTFKESSDYLVIFNFLYGDEATASLGNPTRGIEPEFAGFHYAKWVANSNREPSPGIH